MVVLRSGTPSDSSALLKLVELGQQTVPANLACIGVSFRAVKNKPVSSSHVFSFTQSFSKTQRELDSPVILSALKGMLFSNSQFLTQKFEITFFT